MKMSYTVPLTDISEQQMSDLREKLARDLMKIMMEEAGLGESDIAIRDLTPADFSGTATDAQFVNQTVAVTDVYNALVTVANDVTLIATRAIAFYGYFNRAAVPTLTTLRFSVGGVTTLGQYYVEPCYVTGRNGCVFVPPVIYHPTDQMQIQGLFSAATAVNSEVMGFLGLVAEKAGAFISGRGSMV